LAGLAKLRAGWGDMQKRLCLSKGHCRGAHADFIAELGILREGGRCHNAQKQFALVEYIGMLGHINQVLHNRGPGPVFR